MKKVTISSKNISSKQWTNLMLELNLIKKEWSNYATLEIQGTGLKKILAFGTKNTTLMKGIKVTKTLIILILLFDGTFLKEKFELPVAMTAYECLDFADKYRETVATFKNNHYYLNDNRGTIQGFIC
jgi:hypothetical protein